MTRIRSRTTPAIVLAATLLALASSGAARAAAASVEQAADVLVRTVSSVPADRARLEAELAAAGADVIPFLVDAASRRTVPIPRKGKTAIELPLTDASVAAIAAALARLPRTSVWPVIEGIAHRSDESSVPARMLALDVLARSGTEADLDLAARLATGVDAPCARDAFEHAIAAILARRPAARVGLAPSFAALDPSLVQSFVRAAAAGPAHDALPSLAALLGVRRAEDAALLVEIARIAPAGEDPAPDDLCAIVRNLVEDADPRVAAPAATAAAALRDDEAIPFVAGLLSSFDRDAASTAGAALRRLSGLDLGRDAEAWRSWYAAECAWWRANAVRVENAVAAGAPAAAVAALQEIARRPIFRPEVAEILARGLDRAEPAIARLACQALGRVRSPSVDAWLARASSHTDPGVREAARDGLRLRKRERERERRPRT